MDQVEQLAGTCRGYAQQRCDSRGAAVASDHHFAVDLLLEWLQPEVRPAVLRRQAIGAQRGGGQEVMPFRIGPQPTGIKVDPESLAMQAPTENREVHPRNGRVKDVLRERTQILC
ncbi:hypothetical protein D3C72_1908080 [compost metagenome]